MRLMTITDSIQIETGALQERLTTVKNVLLLKKLETGVMKYLLADRFMEATQRQPLIGLMELFNTRKIAWTILLKDWRKLLAITVEES